MTVFNIMHVIMLFLSFALLFNLCDSPKKKIVVGLLGTLLFFVSFRVVRYLYCVDGHFISLKDVILSSQLAISYGFFLLSLILSILWLFGEAYVKGIAMSNLLYISLGVYLFIYLNILFGIIPVILGFQKMELLTLVFITDFLAFKSLDFPLQEFVQVFMDQSGTNIPDIDPAKELQGRAHSFRSLPNSQNVVCIDYRKIYNDEVAAHSSAPQYVKDIYYYFTKFATNQTDMECRVISGPIKQNYPLDYPKK